MAARRYGTHGLDQSIHGTGRPGCGIRGSHHVVASCGGRNPSSGIDVAAMKPAAPVAVLECAGDVDCPAAAGRAALSACSDSAFAAAGRAAVPACSDPAFAVAGRAAVSAYSDLAFAVAGHAAVSACSDPAFAVAGHAAVSACSDPAFAVVGHAVAVAVVEHAAFRAWLARACSVAVGDGLAFRPAAHAVRMLERRFREAKTEPLC